MLVEDEDGLRAMASRLLTRNGYRVREAEDGADAIRLAADPALPTELLVTDMVMPGMLGDEVIDRVRAIRPGCAPSSSPGTPSRCLTSMASPRGTLTSCKSPLPKSPC